MGPMAVWDEADGRAVCGLAVMGLVLLLCGWFAWLGLR